MAWAFFDFDDTLSRGDSILHWNRFLYKRHPLLRLYGPLLYIGMILLALKLIDKMKFKQCLLLPSGKLSEAQQKSEAEVFCREVISKTLYPEVVQTLEKLKSEGKSIAVLTASAGFYLEPLKNLFSIDHFKYTPMKFENAKGGWWNPPKFLETNFKGPRKVEYLANELGIPSKSENSEAFSDHHSDRFLLEFAVKPTAINPNSKLKKLAIENNWPIFIPKEAQNALKLKTEKIILFLFAWI